MVALVANDVSFCHSSRAELLSRVTFRLERGFAGLVGENGAGKSTLLALLAGRLAPDDGAVRTEPPGARVVLCAQPVDARADDVGELAHGTDPVAARLRGLLELEPDAAARWTTLSPGERKRWQVGAALAQEPDVLLLDEPTNHLDARGRALLLGALRRFRGVGVVVSHDRALLDELTDTTLRIHATRVVHHPGRYSDAREDWRRDELAARRDREELALAARRAAARLADARRAHDAAERSRGSAARMKDANDSDARSALAKGRSAFGEARAGRVVTVRRAEAERARAALAQHEVVRDELVARLHVGYSPAPRHRLLSLDRDELRAGDRVVLRDVHLWLDRDARVRLEGPNGAGKTTLLRAMLAASAHDERSVTYTPQELDAAERRLLLHETRALPAAERGEVLSLVAALGTPPERLLASRLPSPGEAKKLLLARALQRRAWALVLDEPTNHLDLPTVERLEAALRSYPGALLLVSHDDAFAAACTTERWRIEGGRVHLRGAPGPRAATPA